MNPDIDEHCCDYKIGSLDPRADLTAVDEIKEQLLFKGILVTFVYRRY